MNLSLRATPGRSGAAKLSRSAIQRQTRRAVGMPLNHRIVCRTNGHCAAHTARLTKHQKPGEKQNQGGKENNMILNNLRFKLTLAGLASAAFLVSPAMS